MSLSILHNAIDDWLLDNQRPFFNLKTDIMVIGAQEALSRRKPDLEAVTLVLAELSHRSNKAASNAKSHVQDRLEEINHQPIQWLFEARNSLKLLSFEEKPNENYTASTYVILRDGYSNQNGRYGIYVGQTTKSLEQRFNEHLTGNNAGRGMQNHGLHLMRSLMWPWQKVPGSKRLFFESALHRALELGNKRVPKVTGDFVPIDEWPEDFQLKLRQHISNQNGLMID